MIKFKSIFGQRFSTFIAAMIFTLGSGIAVANPQGGVVTNGSASISQSGNTTTIDQSSQKAIINWNSFNINQGQTTNFQQPSNGIALNRINPNQGASQIYGTLSATGRIILINGAGIYFGPGAVVNVGSIIASTSDISNANFLAGNYVFNIPSNYRGSIINAGTIKAANYGLVALLGTSVVNSGMIKARLGNIVLGSGDTFTLSFDDNQLINFAINSATATTGVDQNGNALANNISNTGSLLANGGNILVTAQTAQAVLNNVINMQGVAQAKSVAQRNGSIILSGGNYGTVNVTGILDASGTASGSTGGLVKILGNNIVLGSSAIVNVSGDAGGGDIYIGGEEHGAGPDQDALTTTVSAGSFLNASAISSGNGGNVIVWSNDATNFAGTILAEGGASGGNGGFSEVSGHDLNYDGTVNLTAANGVTGTLLLDPYNVIIETGSGSGGSTVAISDGTYTPTSSDSILTVADLEAALAMANVNVTTGSGGATDDGDISVNNALSWSSSSTLALNANNNIYINASITATNGGLVLNAAGLGPSGTGSGPGVITSGEEGSASATGVDYAINVGSFNLEEGIWNQINPTLPAFSATNFEIASGNLPASTNTQFIRATNSSTTNIGTSTNPYQISDIYGFQGIASNTNTLAADFDLANNINATGTANWNDDAGFVPIGNSTTPFTGSVNGNGYTISNLSIDLPGSSNVGLFGYTSGATIENIGLINPAISGASNVGALIGYAAGGDTISNSYVSGGSVTGASGGTSTGGLVGYDNSSISGSYNTASVNGYDSVGGLVGWMDPDGSITNSYSTGAVNGVSVVGGLIGLAAGGTISTSYSTGSVTGPSNLGGFIGENNGATINTSYSTGNVTGNGGSGEFTFGGFVGYNSSGSISNSYSTGTVNAPGDEQVGGFVGSNNASISTSYSLGNIIDPASLTYYGGFGGRWFGGSFSDDYFDTTTSGISSSEAVNSGTATGVTGLTDSQMMNLANIPGNGLAFYDPDLSTAQNADDDNVWVMAGYPHLTMENTSTITNIVQLQLIEVNPTGTYTIANNIDASATVNWNGGAGFTPVGNSTVPFSGSLTGASEQTYLINNLYINTPSTLGIGLFGYASTATIQYIGLTNETIPYTNSSYVGGLIGYVEGAANINYVFTDATITDDEAVGGLIGIVDADGATISNSYSDSTINSSGDAGGLVGYETGSANTITTSYSGGSVTGGANSYSVGGFIGFTNGGGPFTNDYTTADVTLLANTGYAGGFVGYNEGTTIQYAYSSGTISVPSDTPGTNVGGFAGYNNGTISDIYWDEVNAPAYTSAVSSGGDGTLTAATGITSVSEALNSSTYSKLTFGNGGWVMINGSTRPMLQMEESTTIFNAHQLELMNENLSANYTLGADINMSGTTNPSDVWDTSTTNGGAGFNPIGSFASSFNGNDFTISNLYIYLPSSTNVGLFSSASGSITNLTLANANVTGGAIVGALVGSDSGSLSNDSSSGTVTQETNVASINEAGGLVGSLNGNGSITDSFSSAAVYGGATSSGSDSLGGLVGYTNSTSVSITDSYATGSVVGAGGEVNNDGGLVGSNNATINNAYATGNVSSNGSGSITLVVAGGFVGQNFGAITNAYSIGAVSGYGNDADYLGGFAGETGGGSISSSYFDTTTSGKSSAVGYALSSVSITSENTAGMMSVNMGSDWSNMSGNAFPYLTVFFSETPYAISGSTPGSGKTVSLAVNGSVVDVTETFANSTYYFLESANTVAGDSNLLIYFSSGSPYANDVTIAPASGGAITGANLTANTLEIGDSDTNTISNTNLADALGSLTGSYFLYTASGNNISLSSTALTTTAETTFNIDGNITDSGSGTIKFTAPVIVSASSTLTAGSSITFDSTLDDAVSGGGVDSLTLQSQANILDANVGGSAALENLTLEDSNGDGTGSDNLGAISIKTTDTQTYKNAITLAGSVTLTSSSDDINLDNTINGTTSGAQSLSLQSGNISLSGNIGGTTPLNTLTISDATGGDTGTVSIGNSISIKAANSITLNSAINDVSSGQDNLTLASAVVNLNSNIGATIPLNSLTISDASGGNSGTISIGNSLSIAVANSITLSNANPLSWSSSNTLTLNAANSIYINGNITAPSGSLVFSGPGVITSGTEGSPSTTGVDYAISVANFDLEEGVWNQINTSLPTFSATNFEISQGPSTQFIRATNSSTTDIGTSSNPYQITDIYGLQGIGSNSTTLAAYYILANNIDASSAASWNGGAGFMPVGNITIAFTGSLNGEGYTISNLTMTWDSTVGVGLFGETAGTSSIQNLGLITPNITGYDDVAALVGAATGTGMLYNDYVSGGSVTGITDGAIVGYDSGTNLISNTYNSATINGSGNAGQAAGTGGIIGDNVSATIENSYNTGIITGDSYGDIGGIAGINSGNISSSYNTGAISAYFNVGGVVGSNSGTVTDSYSTGAVSGGAQSSYAGGFVGINSGNISSSYSTGAVTGVYYAGGFVGGTTGGTITNAYATGTTDGYTNSGGFVGYLEAGTISNSYSTGLTGVGVGGNGGFAGYLGTGTFSDNYFDTTTSGWNASQGVTGGTAAGVTGWTDSQMMTAGNFTGFNFYDPTLSTSTNALDGNVWVMAGYPQLTMENTSTITNVVQLQLMEVNPTGSYTIANNIDASATVTWNGGAGFTPVGNSAIAFTGTFNGHGYTISNLSIDLPGSDYVGLFGYTSGATIENIGLINPAISGASNVGALIGYAAGGDTISNSYVSGGSVTGAAGSTITGGLVGYDNSSISGSYNTASVNGYDYVGGLVGWVDPDGSITDSYSTGAVNGGGDTGGFVGHVTNGMIADSYSTGNVSTEGVGGSVGGFAGYSDGTISNSYSTGNVTNTYDNAYDGGFIGYNAGTVSTSYSLGSISIPDGSVGAGAFVGGGVAGYIPVGAGTFTDNYWDTTTSGSTVGTPAGNVSGVTGLTDSQIMNLANISDNGFSFYDPTLSTATNAADGNVWVMAGYPHLAMENTSTITNVVQLQLMEVNPAGTYTIANNIDASATVNWNGGAGFTPIGNSTIPFSGSLTGANDQTYLINNLYINEPGYVYVGLFAYASTASIQYVGLTNETVIGGNSVGGLIGYSSGAINLNYVFTDATVTGGEAIGGLIGETGNGGTISNSYSDSTINAGGDAGGLVGVLLGDASITTSYSGGSVTGGGGDDSIGGIVGYANGGSITNAYTTSDITLLANTGYAGGFVGYDAATTIQYAYSSGTISVPSGSTNVGGFAGFSNGGISDIYWDEVNAPAYTSAVGTEVGSVAAADATGITSVSEALDQSTYSTFSFGSTPGSAFWYSINGSTLPMLQMEYSTSIENAHQLELINMDLTANYSLANNINLSAVNTATDVWAGLGFAAIGAGSSFTGVFNGNGYTISNLSLANAGTNANYGLFATNAGTIENVGLVNTDIDQTITTGSGVNFGALAGTNLGTINDVFVTGSIEVSDGDGGLRLGGIAGVNGYLNDNEPSTINITNSYDTAAVMGIANSADFLTLGGIVGSNGNALITSSYSVGDVVPLGGSLYSVTNYIGGFAGENQSVISNSYYDLTTSGQGSAVGAITGSDTQNDVTTESTSAMMTLDMGSGWSTISGVSFPYLTEFYPVTPRVVSGTTPVADTSISLATNGSVIDSAGTFADGSYYFLESNGAIADGATVLTYLSSGSTYGNVVTLAPASGGSLTGEDITANTITVGDSNTNTLSNSLLSTAIGSLSGSDILYSASGNNITTSSSASFNTTATTTYSVDSGTTLTLNAGGILSGSLSGSGTIDIVGGYAVGIGSSSANNSGYSGTIELDGILNIDSDTNSDPLGTGTLAFYGGVLEGSATANPLVNPVVVYGNTTIGGSGSITFNNTVMLNSGATLSFGNVESSVITLANSISGAGGLNVNSGDGTGIVSVSSSNSSGYSGLVTLTAGTLQAANSSDPFGTGALTLNGGTLSASTATTLDNSVSVGSGGSATVGGSQNITFTNPVTFDDGTGSLTLSDSGIVTLNGLSGPAYTGSSYALIISGSTVSVGGNNDSFAGTIETTNSTIEINNANPDLFGTGIWTLNGSTYLEAISSTVGGTVANSFAGVDGGGTGNFTVEGSQSINLSGSGSMNNTWAINNTATTTFSGNFGFNGYFDLNAGTLVLSGSNSGNGNLGIDIASGALLSLQSTNALGTQDSNMGFVNVASGAEVDMAAVDLPAEVQFNLSGSGLSTNGGRGALYGNYSSGTGTINGVVSLGSGTTVIGVAGGGTLTLSSTSGVNFNSSSNTLSVIPGTGGVINIAGPLTGTSSSAGTLDAEGPGTLSISSANGSSYSGAVNLEAGTLQAANASDPFGIGALTLNGGTLSAYTATTLDNSSVSVGNGDTVAFGAGADQSITFSNQLNTGNSSSILNFNTGNDVYLNGLSGSGAVNVTSGDLYFGGSNSSFNGSITLGNATLTVNNTNTDPFGTGNLNIDATTGDDTGSITSNVSSASAIVNNFTLTSSAYISGANNISFSGTGTLNPDETLTVINTGTTSLNGSLSGGGNLTINTTGAFNASSFSGGGDITITNSGGASFSGAVSAGSVTLTNSSGTIAFNGALTATALNTAAEAYDLQLNAGGSVTAATTFLNTGGVTLDGTILFSNGVTSTASANSVNGTVDTSAMVIDLGAVTLGGTSSLDATNAGVSTAGNNISIGAVTSAGNSLNLDAGTTGVITGSTFSGNGDLTITNSAGASFSGAVSAGSVTLTNSSGTIAFNGALTATALNTAAEAYDLQLNAGGSVTAATTLLNTGGVTLDGTLLFSNGLTSTASANSVNGTVDTSAMVIDLGAVTLGGTSSLDATNAGVSTAGNNISIGAVTSAGNSLNLDAGTTGVITGSTFSGNGDLTITNSAGASFSGAVSAGSVTLTNSSGTIAFNGALTATALNTAAEAYDLQLNAGGSVTAATTFLNTGGVTLDGTLLFSNGVTSTASANSVNGTVDTSAMVIDLSAVTLGGTSSLDATNAGVSTAGNNISIGAVTSAGNSLNLDAGTTGVITGSTFSGNGDLTITNSAGASFSGAVSAGSVTLTNSSGTIAFNGALTATALNTAAEAYDLQLNAGGSVTAATTLLNTGGVTLDGTLLFSNGLTSTASANSVNGTVDTSAMVIDLGAVTLGGASSLDATNAGVSTAGNNISIGAVTSAGNSLNLDAGTTGVITGSTFSGNGDLTITNSAGASFSGAVSAGSVTLTNSSGTIAFNGALTATALNTAAEAYDLQLNAGGSVTAATTFLNTGGVTLDGTILFSNGVTSTASANSVNGTVDTSAMVIDLGAVTLGGTSSLDATNAGVSTAGNNISIGAVTSAGNSLNLDAGTTGVITGSTFSGNGDLTITNSAGASFSGAVSAGSVTLTNSSGTIAFNGALTATALNTAAEAYDLQLNAGGSVTAATTFLNTGGVTLDGTILFSNGVTSTASANSVNGTVDTSAMVIDLGAVTLGGTSSLDATNAGVSTAGNNISIGAVTSAGNSLNLDAGTTGVITGSTFSGNGDLTITNSAGASFSGAVSAGSVTLTNSSGTIAFNGALTATALNTAAEAYDLQLNAGGSVTAATTFLNTGGVTLDGTLLFSNGVTSTASANSVNGTVDTSAMVIDLSAVTLGGASSLDATNAGVSTAGNNISIGAVTSAGNSLNLDAGTTGVITGSTFSGNGDLTITNSAGASFSGAVSAGSVTLTNSSGTIAFNGALTATALNTAAEAYDLQLNAGGSVTAATTFLNTGGVTLDGTLLFSNGVTSTASANSVNGTVDTSAMVIDLSAVTLGGTSSLDATNAGVSTAGNNISIGAVTSAGNSLNLDAGTTGVITGSTFSGNGDLTITNSAGASFSGAVSAGSVTLTNSSGTIAFNGALTATALNTAAEAYDLQLNAGGSVTAATTLLNTGGVTLDGTLLFSNGLTSTASANSVNGTVDTSAMVIDLGAVTLGGASSLDATNAGVSTAGNNISIGAVTSAGNSLNLDAGTTGVITGSTFSGNGDLTITNSAGASFSGAVSAGSVTLTNSSGTIAFNGALTATALNTAAEAYDLQLNAGGSVTAATTLLNTGGVTLDGTLLFSNGVTSTASANSVNATVDTSGTAIDFANLSLDGSTTLDTTNNGAKTAGANISIGATNGGQALILNSGTSGDTTLNSVIGGSTSLSSLKVTGQTITIDANVTTTDEQSFTGNTILDSDINLTSTSSGNISLSAITGNGHDLTINTNGSSIISGIFSDGSGSSSLTKMGSGTLTLNAINTYSGMTNIDAGILSLAAGASLSSATIVNLSNTTNTALMMNNNNLAISGLTGGGTTGGNVVLGSGTLTINNSSSDNYAGVISGTGNFIMTGGGALTLNGVNTYSGTTSINNATLELGVNNALSNATNVTIGANGVLDINNNISTSIASLGGEGTVNLGSGGALTTGSGATTTFSGALTGSGTLTVVGAGSMTVSGSNTLFTGTTDIVGGKLILTSSSALGANDVNLSAGGSLALSSVNIANAINLNGGTLEGSGTSSVSGNVTVSNSSTVSTSASSDEFTLSGNVDGAASLVLQGAGTIHLAGAVGSSTPLTSLTSNAGKTQINSSVETSGNQTYNGAVVLGGNVTLTATGNSSIALNDGVSGNYNLTITGVSQNTDVSLSGSLAVDNITVTGGGSNNSLNVKTGDAQTWNITSTGNDSVSGITQLTGAFNFTNIQNINNNGSSLLGLSGNTNSVVTITGGDQGFVNDPTNFNGFNIISNNGTGTAFVVFNPGTTVVFTSPTTALVNGSAMTFINIQGYSGNYTPYNPNNNNPNINPANNEINISDTFFDDSYIVNVVNSATQPSQDAGSAYYAFMSPNFSIANMVGNMLDNIIINQAQEDDLSLQQELYFNFSSLLLTKKHERKLIPTN